MNITINRISNGWIVAVAVPQGQTAYFYATDKEMLQAIAELVEPPANVTKLPERK